MQQTVLEWIAGIGLLGAMLGCIYALAVCIIVLRFARSSEYGPAPTPPVTIMVPLHGAEPRLFVFARRCAARIMPAFCNWSSARTDLANSATDVIRRLQAAFPDRSIALRDQLRRVMAPIARSLESHQYDDARSARCRCDDLDSDIRGRPALPIHAARWAACPRHWRSGGPCSTGGGAGFGLAYRTFVNWTSFCAVPVAREFPLSSRAILQCKP